MSTRIRKSVVAVPVVLLSVALSASAQDLGASDRRGWVFGGGLTGGRIGFIGAQGRAVAVGGVTGYQVPPYGGTVFERRSLALVDRSAPAPADAVLVAPFPKSAGGMAMTMHGGYAFSPRLALLADFVVMAPYDRGFTQLMAGAVVRYQPARRLWVEAGPAAGELGYAYGENVTTEAIKGSGLLAGAGVTVLQKRKWTLDVQARYGRIWYDGFQATSLSFGLSAGRVRSGKANGGKVAASRS